MKYKIGDKVKIKKLEEIEKGITYIPEMKEFADTIMTIECVHGRNTYICYTMEEDGHKWYFSPNMIEGLASSTSSIPSPFKPSDLQDKDIILHRDGEVGIVVDDIILYKNEFNYLKDYKESFEPFQSDYDVMAVRRPNSLEEFHFNAFEYKCGELVYDRERDSVVLDEENEGNNSVIELTIKEVYEIIEEISKAFNREIKIIDKN